MGRSRSGSQNRKRGRNRMRGRGSTRKRHRDRVRRQRGREVHRREQNRWAPVPGIRASGVLAAVCAGLCALFTVGVLVTLPGVVERERAYGTYCATGDDPDTCTAAIRATVTDYLRRGKEEAWVVLDGPRPADGRFELRAGTVDWPGMQAGQTVTANVWRGAVVTVAYRGSTASVHADSPGGDTALRITIALAGAVGVVWAALAARRHLSSPAPRTFERWPRRVRVGSALIAWSLGIGGCFDIAEAAVGWVPLVWGAGALLLGVWTWRITPDPNWSSSYGDLVERLTRDR